MCYNRCGNKLKEEPMKEQRLEDKLKDALLDLLGTDTGGRVIAFTFLFLFLAGIFICMFSGVVWP
jgi:hypothetical protein